jgi:hypothetical protein
MSSEQDVCLLAELQDLLEQQIASARRGSFSAVLRLAGQCEPLVAKIASAGLFEKPEHKAAKQRLAGLYRDLHLLLSTQQSAVAEQIKSVRKGRKTLSIYRDSI